jgi:glycosyltransferase involved in cell wall biosynthesis
LTQDCVGGANLIIFGQVLGVDRREMQDDGVIFFDLTQLVLRVADPTPDGIGRVELAYARHLLANYPDRVRFLFALPRLVQVIPMRVAARYIRAIEAVWKKEDSASDNLIKDLERFLSSDLSFLAREEPLSGPLRSRRFKRVLVVADLLMNAALQFVRPRNLGRYSNSKSLNAYISVSNSTYSSKWLIRWLNRSPSVVGIILVHDIIPISNPEYTLAVTTIRHRKYVQRVAESAHTIIANSAYTRDCLQEYAASANLPLPPVEVAPLGVDSGFICEGDFRQPTTPYFVFIATIEPRKNHTMLLQVWQRLVAKLGLDTPKLLLIGRRGWENENTVDLIERAEGLRKYVMECSNVPDQLLIKLLANARAALFPSHVEGFGLPLAEALSLGAPVICSDLPPFKEIAGDIPEYVDPLAGRGWLRLITEYAAVDSPKRAAQLERMKSHKAHRWDDHLAVLDSILLRSGVAAPQAETSGTRTPIRPEVDAANRI